MSDHKVRRPATGQEITVTDKRRRQGVRAGRLTGRETARSSPSPVRSPGTGLNPVQGEYDGLTPHRRRSNRIRQHRRHRRGIPEVTRRSLDRQRRPRRRRRHRDRRRRRAGRLVEGVTGEAGRHRHRPRRLLDGGDHAARNTGRTGGPRADLRRRPAAQREGHRLARHPRARDGSSVDSTPDNVTDCPFTADVAPVYDRAVSS